MCVCVCVCVRVCVRECVRKREREREREREGIRLQMFLKYGILKCMFLKYLILIASRAAKAQMSLPIRYFFKKNIYILLHCIDSENI